MQNFEMAKDIEVIPYDSNWPQVFETEKAIIKEALSDNCLEIYHVGSTSVPGLAAKPKIDIIAVVKNSQDSRVLERYGFLYKGEWNIPFQFGFTKREIHKINLHVFEDDHPEIELNLIFRDHLRCNPQSVNEYVQIKKQLLSDKASFKKEIGQLFFNYTLGKDTFIRIILEKEGYTGLRFLKATHIIEWESYHRIQKEQVFDPINVIYEPKDPKVHANGNFHFVLCLGMRVVTIAHVEFLNSSEAILRSLATDTPYQNRGLGKEMMILLEKWLKKEGIKFLKIHTDLRAEIFYRKLGYKNYHYNDDDIYEQHINLAKTL